MPFPPFWVAATGLRLGLDAEPFPRQPSHLAGFPDGLQRPPRLLVGTADRHPAIAQSTAPF